MTADGIGLPQDLRRQLLDPPTRIRPTTTDTPINYTATVGAVA